jgi:alpha,alpha-trehalase
MPSGAPVTPKLTLTPAECRAVVFDMDGVITDTARVHAGSGRRCSTLSSASAARSGEPFRPFDGETDYRRCVDGKPRYDGVRSFLASRGIVLPEGTPADAPDRETVSGLGNRKNALVRDACVRRGRRDSTTQWT